MWKSINYEVCGRSHLKSATPCQDKTATWHVNDVDAIALADGAGSARYSHIGAAVVTAFVCRYITNNFDRIINNPDGVQVKKDILEHLLTQVKRRSEDLSCNMEDLASTLLAVAVCNNLFIMLHIGDGVIGYLKGNKLEVASYPDNGEFVNTTTFVTSRNAITSLRLLKGGVDDISGFVLMSDGTAQSLYNKKDKFLAGVLVKIMHRTAILARDKTCKMIKDSFDQVIVNNTIDDCSIALLCRSSTVLRDYCDMSPEEKCELLNIATSDRQSAVNTVSRFDEIMRYLCTKKTLRQLSRDMRLKEKYVNRDLARLLAIGLVVRRGAFYLRP